MNRIATLDSANLCRETLADACQILRTGGVIVVPTETVYGMACDPEIPEAIERVREIKGRDRDKPIARLVASSAQAQHKALHWNSGIEALAHAHWPGPLTLVLETQTGWTGFRVPDHPIPIELATLYGSALALTSANLSGEPDARSIDQTHHLKVDLVLNGGTCAPSSTPSSVVRIDHALFEGLREGGLPFSQLKETFQKGLMR
jgi:L-threonylcarbamoyladenylate synthase